MDQVIAHHKLLQANEETLTRLESELQELKKVNLIRHAAELTKFKRV